MSSAEQALSKLLVQQKEALARYKLSDGRWVWVRRINQGNPRLYYDFQTFIALCMLKVPPLRAVSRGSQAAIVDEANRLRALAQAQIMAPRLLAQLPEGLMMSDLSVGYDEIKTLDQLLHEQLARGDDPLAFWSAGLEALGYVHQKQQYLSQAFARNIIVLDQKEWAFIDFEEDPIHYLNLSQCQVRDLLFYLHSTLFLIENKAEAAAVFRQHIRHEASELRACFNLNAQRLVQLRGVALMRRLGRDGNRIADVLVFLQQVMAQ